MVGINAPYYTIGYQAVRLVNAVEKKASLVNEMSTGRWYPSTATLADGSILIVGGAQIVRYPHSPDVQPCLHDLDCLRPMTFCSHSFGGYTLRVQAWSAMHLAWK